MASSPDDRDDDNDGNKDTEEKELALCGFTRWMQVTSSVEHKSLETDEHFSTLSKQLHIQI